MQAAVDDTSAAADDIATNVGEQHGLLEDAVGEMQSFAAAVGGSNSTTT